MSAPLIPVQKPITGREEIADSREPLYALVQFYKALHARDLMLMEQNWDSSPETAMDNPLGGIKRGWPEIRETYGRLFGTKWQYSFPFSDYTVHQTGDVFWVVGREHGHLTKGDETLDVAIRTTRLFRRTGARWRQVHHHGSIEDPQQLAAYLAAVKAGQ